MNSHAEVQVSGAGSKPTSTEYGNNTETTTETDIETIDGQEALVYITKALTYIRSSLYIGEERTERRGGIYREEGDTNPADALTKGKGVSGALKQLLNTNTIKL